MMKSVLVLAMAFAAVVPAFGQDTGWIGVTIVDRPEGGVLVRSVEPNSPAERAGLRANDVIVQYNRQEVVGVVQLTRLVTETPVGRTVEVTARRDNMDQTLKVTAERAPFGLGNSYVRTHDLTGLNERIFQTVPRLNVHTLTVVHSGIQVSDMTPQLREFFGVAAAQGVLVTSVDANSAAARAGLRAGDVVIAIDGRPVATPSDFVRQRGAATVTYRIVRDKQERDLSLTP